MAKKGGKRGSSAARSAAAKKGWETRRRGGAAAKSKPGKPAATAPTKPTKPRGTGAKATSKPTAAKPAPKTTSARGRARTNATAARQQLRAGGGSRAARTLLTAQRASAYYKATGTGTKRSPSRGGAAPAKATAARAKMAVTARAAAGPAKTTLDEARWKRIVQRARTRGEVRAYIEGKRTGGYNASTEKRVFAAYATRQRAEQFLLRLTRSKTDKSIRGSQVSGLAELNANFLSRGRGGTGSTSIGVAARNRIYDEQRKAKRAANKAAREQKAKAAKPLVQMVPVSQVQKGRTVRISRGRNGVISQPKIRLRGDGGTALRSVISVLPSIPKGRKPSSGDASTKVFETSLGRSVRLGGRQRAALQKELERQGFSHRSNASGSVQTYSRQFATSVKNPRGQAEIMTIQLQMSGRGGLAGGSVSASRSLFVDRRQRNTSGGLIESAYGLRRPKPRGRSVRRRR